MRLYKIIDTSIKEKWIMTYDKCDLIRNLYNNYYIQEYELSYVAGGKKKGTEFFISNFYIGGK